MNHWWQAPLYVSARGLTTSAIPYRGTVFDIEFDFVDHQLRIRTTTGQARAVALEPQPVPDFYARTMSDLPQAIRRPPPSLRTGRGNASPSSLHGTYLP